MREIELIQQMMTGDTSAFDQWMDYHSDNLERFAIQCGCTRERAGKVTEETFRSFYTDLENVNDEERLRYDLYRIMLEKLVAFQETEPLQAAILSFEEDQQLHEKINRLEDNAKLSLILSQFHNMNDVEIAMIVGIPADAVKEAIAQAVKRLTVEIDSSLLDKRLAYLEKSYGRIHPTFRKYQVFEGLNGEIQEPSKTRQSISKKVMISWAFGMLTLLAFIIVPVVAGEEYQKASAEKYVERLKVSFEEEMATRFTELGLTESTKEEERELHYIPYGKQARIDFESMTDSIERVLEETGTINKEKISEQYDDIIKTLELPAEMAERLVKTPLTADKEKSEEFMGAYLNQLYILQEAYYRMFLKHEETIAKAIGDDTVNPEKFIEDKDEYPEDFQKVLEGMVKQNIYPTSIPEWGIFIPNYKKNEFSTQFRAAIHKNLGGYITQLESAPFIYYPDLAYSLDESVDYLKEMEETLLTSQVDGSPYFSLDNYFKELFFEIVVGSEPGRIFGADGKVKEEVKSAWKKIAFNRGGSPSGYIMKKVVKEMETSGWTESETQSRLTMYHLDNALELAKEGKLHAFDMNDLLQTDRGFDSITFPDANFENLVEETYKRYSVNHNPAVLKDVHPLVIFAVYCFANDNEDAETMWHLYKPEGNSQTLEAYLSGWRKEEVKLYEMDSLQFDRSGSSNGNIGLSRGNFTSFTVQMRLNEEAIWEIEFIYLDPDMFK